MEDRKTHFIILLSKGKNASQACNKICQVYGEDILKNANVEKFRRSDFSLKDEQRAGRLLGVNDNKKNFN